MALGNPLKSSAFLKRMHPNGFWCLTAIDPNKKGIETKTFSKDTELEMLEWIQKHNNTWNIYWHVNQVIKPLKKKATREHIKEVNFFHVDVDPLDGRDIDKERDRISQLFSTELPKGIPEPTAVVFSGGGFQAFWKLETPIEINGEKEKYEDAKRYNQQLETVFGADNCHNIDRLCRLVGTVNVPDAKKLKKGRRREESTLVSFKTENIYKTTDFIKAVDKQTDSCSSLSSSAGSGSGVEVNISGNIKRIEVEDLDEYEVPDRVKVIIVQGTHPDQPKEHDNSRSAWVFDTVCSLVRCSVPDDIIFSILTDPDFGISASILENKSNASSYAIRQIQRGHEEAIDPWLRKLNQKFAVIGNYGGRCRVVEEVIDAGLNRARLTKQSFEDFRNRYMNKKIQVGTDPKSQKPIYMPVGKWWLLQDNRRQYDSIVFAPLEVIPNVYNLWRGFAYDSIPGDCKPFLDHCLEVICDNNEETFKWLVGWMARAVQQPASQGEVAIVLQGGRGTGKSLFVKMFGRLFGRHFLHISNSSHLVGNFNSHLRDTVVLFADEAFYANDKKHESVLKTLITEETIPIESKGVDVEVANNYVHLLMASNSDHVVPAGHDERRFLALRVSDLHKQDTMYFGHLVKSMEDGGYEALLNYLQNYDLEFFDIRKPPMTAALYEQKLLSMTPEEEWWYQKLYYGVLMDSHEKWEPAVLKEYLFNDYVSSCKDSGISRRSTATSLGKFMKKVCPNIQSQQLSCEVTSMDGTVVMKRLYHYIMPNLYECRKKWETLFGEVAWLEPEELKEINNPGDVF